jgi:hypothetical protein
MFFGAFVKNQLGIAVNSYVGFLFFSTLFISIFCQCHAVVITTTLKYSLKFGIVIPPALFILLSTVLAICGVVYFQMNYRVDFSFSVENITEILMEIALNV